MRLSPARAALAVVLGAAVLSCKDSPTSVKMPRAASALASDATASPPKPEIVISQIYGGGANSSAVFKYDYIELFNPGMQPVDVSGWSVQYAASGATSGFNQATPLSGVIPPGGYYLVQEATQSATSTLPTLPLPHDSGTINLSATAGKVALVKTTSTTLGACPISGSLVVDVVSFGSAAGCDAKTTPAPSNTMAIVRGGSGCAYSGDLSADFKAQAPNPRTSATAPQLCDGSLPAVGSFDHVAITGTTTVSLGGTTKLTALAQDAANRSVNGATITWSSGDDNVATVDNDGQVTGLALSTTSVKMTATAQKGDTTRIASVQVTVTAPAIGWIDVSSSSTSFPAGFQTQLFATARVSQGGQIVPASFTFEAVDPEIATVANVANSGIISGISAPNGSAKPGIRIIATPNPDNGTKPDTFVTRSITIEAPVSSPTSIYATNDEFGDPTPATTSNPNDLLIKRPQYTLSYNESRGTPNWVAYELDARQIVPGQDRCNCFTADPTLPTDKQIFTSDYTNGGFDRGHMARSFDRTTANADNASTFYLTNIVPQQADLNQGVWAQLENALGDSATKGGRAVYIVTGPLYSRSHGLTFLKNEGKVAVPDSTWKIALIGPRTAGNPFTRGNVQSWDDLAGVTILAVNMPNVSGVRNDPWSKYLTTVSKIEEATGYHFLTVLDAAFRGALEVGDHAPAARYAVNGALAEGTALTFDASASSDADAGREDLGRPEALTYQWQFSDGAKATGPKATHTFAKFGAYTATLTVTDAFGWPSTVTQTLNIGDVAPGVSSLRGATLITGETYSAAGSFVDPGADVWSATVNYGDGGGAQLLALVDKSFAVAHTYANAGTFTLTVTVNDDGGAKGQSSAAITVITPFTATQGLGQQVQILAEAGAIVGQQVQPLLASLDAASKQIQRGNNVPAANELGAFVNKLTAAVMSGRMSPEAAQQLSGMVPRIQHALGQ